LSDNLIFGIVYIPPEGSSYLSPDAFDQVENEYRVLSQNSLKLQKYSKKHGEKI
jgi:hypothetical protein